MYRQITAQFLFVRGDMEVQESYKRGVYRGWDMPHLLGTSTDA